MEKLEHKKISQEKQETEQEKRARLISRYIETKIIKGNESAGELDEKEITEAVENMQVSEKAVKIYEDMMSYVLTNQEKHDKKEKTVLDPYIISELSILWNDEKTRQVFLEKFSKARVESKKFKLSDIKQSLQEKEINLKDKKDKYTKLKQKLNLHKFKSPAEKRVLLSKSQNLKKSIDRTQLEINKIINLNEHEHTKENTDVAALIGYERLRRYRDEAQEGFAWLPSRVEIHNKISDVIKHTGKAPLLIGPPGTGKTTQIDAVAIEHTAVPALRIPCHSGLSEEGLIFNRDIKKGEGARDYVGTIAEGFTGFKHSQDEKPYTTEGQFVNLDEISQLNIEKAMAPIKDVRQAKPGKSLSRYVPEKVLYGSHLAATSNLPISDERLEREFARIPTNYFEMKNDNPELYEFILSKLLLDEGNLYTNNKTILAPAYEKKDIPEEQRKKLKDGSIVVATSELIEYQTDARHGFLYRLSYAIRAIQDSYIHGSKFNEKHMANTALYEDFDENNNLVIKGYLPDLKLMESTSTIGGDMLKLKSGSSTLTAEIISKWTDGFINSGEQDLVKWFQKMLQDHIGQTASEDGERIKAIADYFHIFDDVALDISQTKPLTPKEIGYLSPRVPRPVYTEKPNIEGEKEEETQENVIEEVKEYETKQVLLEDGTRILIKESEFNIDENIISKISDKFIVGGKSFIFAGTVEDKSSDNNNNKPVGQLAGGEEELYKIFSAEELDFGVIEEFKNIIGETGIDDIKENFINYWKIEGCEEEKGEFEF